MGRGTDAALFEKIEIEVIDREDVVERCLDRREEAGAFGFEFAKLQLQHGTIEPVVRPQIVAGHAAQMVKQGHGVTPPARTRCKPAAMTANPAGTISSNPFMR